MAFLTIILLIEWKSNITSRDHGNQYVDGNNMTSISVHLTKFNLLDSNLFQNWTQSNSVNLQFCGNNLIYCEIDETFRKGYIK